MLKEYSKKYFYFFKEKNIKEISEMLSDNIQLTDWTISCSGKNKVIKFYEKIFNDVDLIEINIANIYSIEFVVIAQLEIFIDDNDPIDVVDIIQFNESNEITKIKAYKC